MSTASFSSPVSVARAASLPPSANEDQGIIAAPRQNSAAATRTPSFDLNIAQAAYFFLSHGGQERTASTYSPDGEERAVSLPPPALRTIVSPLPYSKSVLLLFLFQGMMDRLTLVGRLLLKSVPPLLLMYHFACTLQASMMNILTLIRHILFSLPTHHLPDRIRSALSSMTLISWRMLNLSLRVIQLKKSVLLFRTSAKTWKLVQLFNECLLLKFLKIKPKILICVILNCIR